ncbi:MAG: DNA repair protein RadC [Bacteroidota bacterium]
MLLASLQGLPENCPHGDSMYSIPIYKIRLLRDGNQKVPSKNVSSPEVVAEILSLYLKGQDREHLIAIMLDARKKVIGINTVSIGSLTAAIVHPREVFKAAILSNAHSIIIGHNHPSGDPTPSQEDITVTSELVRAGKLLKIPVIDHVIIGDDGRFTSLANEGIIPDDETVYG